MSSVVLKSTETSNVQNLFANCISFDFIKEIYTPYTSLKAEFRLSDRDIPPKNPKDIELLLDEKLVHKGIVDKLEVRNNFGEKTLSLTSRGYSSLLGQNEMTPGLISAISLDKLMANYVKNPNITHQPSPAEVNYIYVKEHASFWEAIVNLCLKQYEKYPYISGTNCVNFSENSQQKYTVLRETDKVVSEFSAVDYTKAISDFHMKDTDGAYNKYNLNAPNISALNILRQKHIPLDRQWLDNPSKGLQFKLRFASRGIKSCGITYQGYKGEDLNDKITTEKFIGLKVSAMQICGNSKGITTTDIFYCDDYCNVNAF
ncbi:MAG: hypothetical protein RR540_01240 [Oscillospiraceae bacterium]